MIRVPLTPTKKPIRFTSDRNRVITRFFSPGGPRRFQNVFDRVTTLPDREATLLLAHTLNDFAGRHRDIERVLMDHYEDAARLVGQVDALSDEKMLLVGSYFTMEYAIESAALFNPSIVPAPDQSDAKPGELRIVLSFRATGEGHLSSLEFREATLTEGNELVVDAISPHLQTPRLARNMFYDKQVFSLQLIEMSVPNRSNGHDLETLFRDNEVLSGLFEILPDCFTLEELRAAMLAIQDEELFPAADIESVFRHVRWLACSNYEVRFDPGTCVSERIIFPVSDNERRGIEDARFVRFVDNGESTYYATYTAYDGHMAQTQLLETRDFLDFKISTLNGQYADSKGMALFPRKVNGQYAMISRFDGENLYMMYSDDTHFWHTADLIGGPLYPWEFVQVGNCGSPLETEAGWLLLTHGVGPMRRYCVGAALLGLDDPRKVLGRLRDPLLAPAEDEREGYVPNVVYSCGSPINNNELIMPYAMSDTCSSIATVSLPALLDALLDG